ncbi:MAG: nucleoside hydrolase [Thermoflexus sp.]|nr:nucleoside hydrolase [Thermoflexus sp.]
MRLLVDTDPGVDDALCLLLALCSPEVEVVGITTANAVRMLEVAGRPDTPVAQGAAFPLAWPFPGGAPRPWAGRAGQGGSSAAGHRPPSGASGGLPDRDNPGAAGADRPGGPGAADRLGGGRPTGSQDRPRGAGGGDRGRSSLRRRQREPGGRGEWL